VLPLANLSGDASEEFFARAMTDVLISELGQLPGVRVISRTSVEAVTRSRAPLGEIARKLDVNGIVEGSVVREQNRVRITVHLIDAGRDRQLWSASFERDLSRALEIQGEVSREIASQIRAAVTPELAQRFARERVLTREAQDAYFRGLLRSARFDRESMRAAVSELERAARLAPDYAPAHAQLAAALIRTAVYGEPDAETLPRAEYHVSRALQLDDGSGDAHFTLATLHHLQRDWPRADAEFARGIALGVHEPIIANAYAFHLLAHDQPEAAVTWMNDVAASAPFDLFVNVQRGRVLFMAGRAESALREFDRILATENPRDAQIFALRVYANEGLGRLDEAVREFRRFVEVAGQEHRHAFADELAGALRSRGAAGYWSVWASAAKGDPLRAATAHAHSGELDAAFAALEEAWETRSTASPDVYFIRTSPWLAPLKGDPRFAAFVRRLPQRAEFPAAPSTK
jgi:TolB-like protein